MISDPFDHKLQIKRKRKKKGKWKRETKKDMNKARKMKQTLTEADEDH